MQPRSRARARGAIALACAAAGAAALAPAAVAPAASSRPLSFADRAGDVAGPLDITRVSLRRASDGRLRAVLRFAGPIGPRALLATSGRPGSICLRIYTDREADPAAARPDRLVCVTARSAGALRGGVYRQSGAGPPERVGSASVRRTRSGRSVIVRFAQSRLGRPVRIRFAAEATRPGCARQGCVDSAPERGAVRAFRLR